MSANHNVGLCERESLWKDIEHFDKSKLKIMRNNMYLIQ